MKVAFAFTVVPPVCDDAVLPVVSESAGSLGLMSMPEADRYLVRDAGFTPPEPLFGPCRDFPVDMSGYDSHGFGCRAMSMVAALAVAVPGYDVIVSVPSNWKCVKRIDISHPVRVVASGKDVFCVFFGGNPCAHVDSGGFFMMKGSPVHGYSRLACHAYDVPGLDRMDCPCAVRPSGLTKVSALGDRSINSLNRCGWDTDKFLVLYPDKLSSRPGDGKPEPFTDLVGISPDLWPDGKDKTCQSHTTA